MPGEKLTSKIAIEGAEFWDRKRNENDFIINLKSELQVRSLHQKIDLMQKDQMKVLYETQAKQLELLERIEKKLDHQS